jgi:hypothetical protein
MDAQRILAAQETSDKSSINDRPQLARIQFSIGEGSARQQRDSHRLEKAGPHRQHVGDQSRFIALALDVNVLAPEAATQESVG